MHRHKRALAIMTGSLILVVLLLLHLPNDANAIPVEITSGTGRSFFPFASGTGLSNLSGDGIFIQTLNLSDLIGPFLRLFDAGIFPFTPGRTASVNVVANDGVFLSGVTLFGAPVFPFQPIGVRSFPTLGTASFQFPPLADHATLTVPFSFSANLPLCRFPGLLELDLTGHGLTTIELSLDSSGTAWGFTRITYDFNPIPEPTTLLLFGTTAAGLGLARWVKRRRSHSA
jgi:hypothetical protein